MLSDKLSAKGDYEKKRAQFTRIAAQFQSRYMPRDGDGARDFVEMFQSLMVLNAELAQAPLLFTLQSAAEVGFAHAQVKPLAPEGPQTSAYQPTTTAEVAEALGKGR